MHHDVVEPAVVGVRLVLVTREAAERAADVADVGEVDVAADDVGDLVTYVLEAGPIGCGAERLEVASLRAEQLLRLARRELAPFESALQHAAHGRAGRGEKSVDRHRGLLHASGPSQG
jgi:hypothetical protein